jgi:hypothetical protein
MIFHLSSCSVDGSDRDGNDPFCQTPNGNASMAEVAEEEVRRQSRFTHLLVIAAVFRPHAPTPSQLQGVFVSGPMSWTAFGIVRTILSGTSRFPLAVPPPAVCGIPSTGL